MNGAPSLVRLPEIERLRAFAILIVMIHHLDVANVLLPAFLSTGRHGVDLGDTGVERAKSSEVTAWIHRARS